MGNQQHVEILEPGVDVWNNRREENPGIIPDLSNVDLSKREVSERRISRRHFLNVQIC
jgi:hypothetical protein